MRIEEITCEFAEAFITPPYRKGVMYVSLIYKTAVHLCACGCANLVVTPLLLNGEEGKHEREWPFSHNNNLPTLEGSIGNSWCKAHYSIKEGKIIWHKDLE